MNDDDGSHTSGGILAFTSTGKPLLLFTGIIDLLQQYQLQKMIEHSVKACLYDGVCRGVLACIPLLNNMDIVQQKTVSVCNPSFYSKRFVDFVGNVVFKPIGIEKVREFTHQRHTAEVYGGEGLRLLLGTTQETHSEHLR